MKVMILCADFLSGRGGMETAIATVLVELEKQGDTVTLLLRGGYANKSWITRSENVQVIGTDKDALTVKGKMKFIWGVLASVRKVNPDVIIATNPMAVLLAKMCSKLNKKKILVGSWNHFPLSILKLRRLLKYADFHLAINSGISHDISKQFNRGSTDNIYTVFNPTNWTTENVPRATTFTEFLYVGRLMIGGPKWVADFLKSLSGVRGDWKATIVGDGQEVSELIESSKELGVYEKINWKIGWKEDPWQDIQSASALVMTSEYEGLPMVMIEAMTRGIPCISSNCSAGTSDIITPGRNGWLYPVKDNDSLTRLLQSIVDNPDVLPDPYMVKSSAQRFSKEKVVGEIRKAMAVEYSKMHANR